MHLHVSQRGRQTVATDEMFLRNEEPRAHAAFPWQRLLELLRGAIEFDRDRRRGGRFRRCWQRSDKAIVELDGTPPNRQGGNKKEHRRGHEHRVIVMSLKPIDCLCHVYKKRTTDNTDF